MSTVPGRPKQALTSAQQGQGTPMTALPSQRLVAMWSRLSSRERAWASYGGVTVALAVIWWLALSPALLTLRGAEAKHRQLDAQLQQMLALQAQAKSLQGQARLGPEEALRALEASVKSSLGANTRLQVSGERVTLNLKAVAPDALAQWLALARVNARALPVETHLVQSASVGSTGATAGSRGWDGTVVLALPAR